MYFILATTRHHNIDKNVTNFLDIKLMLTNRTKFLIKINLQFVAYCIDIIESTFSYKKISRYMPVQKKISYHAVWSRFSKEELVRKKGKLINVIRYKHTRYALNKTEVKQFFIPVTCNILFC